LVSPLGTILQYAFTVNGQGQTSLMDLRRLVETSLSNFKGFSRAGECHFDDGTYFGLRDAASGNCQWSW
jgi:hypothetical protein